MTRRDVAGFIREFWWQLGVLAGLVAAHVVQVNAMANQLAEMDTDHLIVQGIGRMMCQNARAQASLAGIPCGRLLYDGGEWRPQ